MRKIAIAGIVLTALPAIARTAPTKPPFTVVEKLTPENAVRHDLQGGEEQRR